MFDKHNISQINEMSIVDIILNSGVSLKKSGRYYIGRCPFHDDKTPSFVVYPESNMWVCYGAGCTRPNGKKNAGGISRFIQLRYGQTIDLPEIKTLPEPEPPQKVPDNFVLYWHSMLEDRTWFYKRGFKDEIINREMWGWDGSRYTIPVWEGEPGNSDCLGVRKRKPQPGKSDLKYIGLKGMNPPTVWGRWYCQGKSPIYAFAGELDAATAVQDGLAAFSLVNGVNALARFPETWVEDWFPGCNELVAVFDVDEEIHAGRLCHQWNKARGFLKGRVFYWPRHLGVKDYCEFREKFPFEYFQNLLVTQRFKI